MLSPGSLFDNRYEITGVLGTGAMGTVYSAVDAALSRTVAIKLLHSSVAENDDLCVRLRREAQVLSNLEHVNIVRIYRYGVCGRSVYLVEELLEGETLKQLLVRVGALAQSDAISIAAKIADGMDLVHRSGIVHRDLKPQNVFVCGEGTDALPKVLDFGLCRIAKSSSEMQVLTQAGTLVGTPKYMSPEAARGETVTARSDIYSLGVMFYEMLTGEPAYDGDDVLAILYQQVHAPVPVLSARFPYLQESAELDRILQRCLDKDADRRFASMGHLRDSLRDLHAAIATTANLASDLSSPLAAGLKRSKKGPVAPLKIVLSLLLCVSAIVVLLLPSTMVAMFKIGGATFGARTAIDFVLWATEQPAVVGLTERRRVLLTAARTMSIEKELGYDRSLCSFRLAALSLSENDKGQALAELSDSLTVLCANKSAHNNPADLARLIEANCALLRRLEPGPSEALQTKLEDAHRLCWALGLLPTDITVAETARAVLTGASKSTIRKIDWTITIASDLKSIGRQKESFALCQQVLFQGFGNSAAYDARYECVRALLLCGDMCFATDNLAAALKFYREAQSIRVEYGVEDYQQECDALAGQIRVLVRSGRKSEAVPLSARLQVLMPQALESLRPGVVQSEVDRFEREHDGRSLLISPPKLIALTDYHPEALRLSANTCYTGNIRTSKHAVF